MLHNKVNKKVNRSILKLNCKLISEINKKAIGPDISITLVSIVRCLSDNSKETPTLSNIHVTTLVSISIGIIICLPYGMQVTVSEYHIPVRLKV